MSRNIINFIRYLKTHNKYLDQPFRLDANTKYYELPLPHHLAGVEMQDCSFTIINPGNLPVPKTDVVFDLEIRPSVSVEEEQIYLALYQGYEYWLQSPEETRIFWGLGKLITQVSGSSHAFPAILQEVSFTADENPVCHLINAPKINMSAFRQLLGISQVDLEALESISFDSPLDIFNENDLLDYLSEIYDILMANKNFALLQNSVLLVTPAQPDYKTIYDRLIADIPEKNLLAAVLDKTFYLGNPQNFFNRHGNVFEPPTGQPLRNTVPLTMIDKRTLQPLWDVLPTVLSQIKPRGKVAIITSEDNFSVDPEILSSPIQSKQIYRFLKNQMQQDLADFTIENPLLQMPHDKRYRVHSEAEDFWSSEKKVSLQELKSLQSKVEKIVPPVFHIESGYLQIADRCINDEYFAKCQSFFNAMKQYLFLKSKAELEPLPSVTFSLPVEKFDEQALEDIIRHLEKQKSFSSLGIGVKKEWRIFLSEIKVKGAMPVTLEDFQFIRDKLQENSSLSTMRDIWSELFISAGFPALPQSEPELSDFLWYHLDSIEAVINWSRDVFLPLIRDLEEAGFNWHKFITEFTEPYVEHGIVYTLIYGAQTELYRLIEEKLRALQKGTDSNSADLSHNLLLSDDYSPKIKVLFESSRDALQYEMIKQFKIEFFTPTHFASALPELEMYDLLIIDRAESLSVRELLFLIKTHRAIIIGDGSISLTREVLSDEEEILRTLLPESNSKALMANNLLQILIAIKPFDYSQVGKLPQAANLISMASMQSKSLSISTLNVNPPVLSKKFSGSLDELLLALQNWAQNLLQNMNHSVNILFPNTKDEEILKLRQGLLNVKKAAPWVRFSVESRAIDCFLHPADYTLILDIGATEISINELSALASSTYLQLFYLHGENHGSSLTKLTQRTLSRNLPAFWKNLSEEKGFLCTDSFFYDNLPVERIVYADNPVAVVNFYDAGEENWAALMDLAAAMPVMIHNPAMEENLFLFWESQPQLMDINPWRDLYNALPTEVSYSWRGPDFSDFDDDEDPVFS